MASLNTNAAAITALRTLQNTNKDLDKTQDRISTGYKIGQAKDNAAYWAISTTLKSDNKSLGTVKDALGLGSSTVDVAYQGLNKAKDVLDEIKSKLTASTQDGVDRDTIQNEIKQLQDQLKSVATSSVFSGENWLSVDTSVLGFNPEKQVVASFSRDGNGSVSIGTIKVQTANIALFDASTVAGSGGILDGAVNLKGRDGRDLMIGGTDVTTGNNQTAGLGTTAATGNAGSAATVVSAASLGSGGSKATVSTGALTLSQYQPGDRITIKFNVNGQTTTITTAALVPAGAALAISDIATALDNAMNGLADVSESPTGILKFDAPANGAATKFDLEEFTLRDSNGKVKAATNTPAATAASYETGTFSAITLDGDDHLYFQIKTDDATAVTNVTIDRTLIDKTLAAAGHVSGRIADATEFKSVLAAALGAAGVKNVNVAVVNPGKVTFTTDSVGANSKLFVSNVAASQGGDTITVDTINISNAFFAGKSSDDIKSILSAYVEVVNSAIEKVKNGAAALGSVASRIDLQKGFVDTLMDTIDKGVGNLIDADMSEESTKLQALQVKQQLGVQALSIANQSSQNILSLFQSNR